jgi:hypothetical protein
VPGRVPLEGEPLDPNIQVPLIGTKDGDRSGRTCFTDELTNDEFGLASRANGARQWPGARRLFHRRVFAASPSLSGASSARRTRRRSSTRVNGLASSSSFSPLPVRESMTVAV